jgi:hypothetical protein
MNWTPEVVRAEMDYRVERALGSDLRNGTTLAQLQAARASHPSWWRRMRTAHREHNPTA